MIISNESRISRSYVVSNFRKPRQYLASVAVRYEDMDAVEGIVGAARSWLEESRHIDGSLPLFVGLASLDNHACNISIVVSFPHCVHSCVRHIKWLYKIAFG